MQGGEDTLRRSIAATTDGRARARLRVELAGVVRARDPAAAREEVVQAFRDVGPTPALTMAALSLARALEPAERVAWLQKLAAPAIGVALAQAQLEANQPRGAALTLLALARDARAPLHHRRAAARKAVRLAGRVDASIARAAFHTSAMLVTGKTRRLQLGRALALPAAATDANDLEQLVATALDWLKDGGGTTLCEEALARIRAKGYASPAVDRLAAALAGQLPRKPPSKAEPAPPRRPPQARPRTKRDPESLFEAALTEARAGGNNRARRLGEEAIRMSGPSAQLAGRVGVLDAALREAGFLKDALRLRRTFLEGGADEPGRKKALLALATEAAEAGLTALAASWRADAGEVLPPSADAKTSADTPAEHYLAAQRLLARGGPDAAPARVLAHLEKALSGHPGADSALALAEKLSGQMVESNGVDSGRRRLDLLRAAHAGEYEPGRRARLGWRLAAQLESVGDAIGAVAVLERALSESAPGEGARVRGERARLLRSLSRPRDLAAALEKDAGALLGDARLPVLAEQASLLEAAGEAERALDVRLMALAEFPGAPAILDDARRRLEETGRAGESMSLAVAALDHTTDRERRLQLLRDVARLSEEPAVNANPSDAASAWLAVLDLDPGDADAAAAAERLLVAIGDWERCADLLAWRVARAGADNDASRDAEEERAALLWRLAELRRGRLGETEEALRLYSQLADRAHPLGPLTDSTELAAFVRRDLILATQTVRAFVASTPSNRSRALVDRAAALAERGRAADAERDALTALELDARNLDAISTLERLYEGQTRARELADELGRRAARLPPTDAAPLYFGRGRAAERAGDRPAAREAYRRAMSLDPALAEPITALGALAAREGDWSEVAALLESELRLATSPKRKGPLLLELATVHGDHLNDPARAVSLLETAARLLPNDPRLMDLEARFNLLAGHWQVAADALDRLAARGATIADAAERYFAVAKAAEAAGEPDRALTLYSRSYGRDSGYRPTLERLAAICFERGQWDNAWKATEALLERHGPALSPTERATLLARSIIADLHIGQRTSAIAKLRTIVTRGPSYVPDAGIRDVAESWAGMHLEPRLLVDVEPRRRERVFGRATQVLALTEGQRLPARRNALEILGALAMAQGRWDAAVTALEALAADDAFEPERRSDFLVTAGDIFAQHYADPTAARASYRRARTFWSGNPSLIARIGHEN